MLGEIWEIFASNRKQKMLIIVKRWLVGMGLQYLSLVCKDYTLKYPVQTMIVNTKNGNL